MAFFKTLGASGVSLLFALSACSSDSSSGDDSSDPSVNSDDDDDDTPSPSGETGDAGELNGGPGIIGGDDDDDEPGNGSGSGDAGASEPGGFKGCAAASRKAELTPANLIFVIDQSGSMNCNAPEDAQGAACEAVTQNSAAKTKWEITSEALSEALDALSDLSNVQAAVTTFPLPDPNRPGESCIEGAAPQISLQSLDATHRTTIDGFLNAAKPSGETPLAGTTILSYAFLAEQLRAGKIDGNSFIVLLTDGTETCKPNEIKKLIEEDVPAAREFNIRTFVIGAPGSEAARGMLSQLAFEGGTQTDEDCDRSGQADAENVCHFDMTQSQDFSKDLAAALRSISEDKNLVCRFDVPKNSSGGGVNLNKVNVVFKAGDGEEVEVLNDPAADCEDGAEGWQYTSDFSQIQLCGEICDQVSEDTRGEVEIILGCPIRSVAR